MRPYNDVFNRSPVSNNRALVEANQHKSDKIERDIRKFLDRGGKITECIPVPEPTTSNKVGIEGATV